MKRTPGRPPLDDDDRSVPVTFSLPSKQLAVVSEHAKHDRLTVQDWIRASCETPPTQKFQLNRHLPERPHTQAVVNRAYALFRVKAVDGERRTITGIATTPEPDRAGDIIEPLGVTFKNPLPLLLFHDAKKPVGVTKFAKPTKEGIAFEATLPTIDEPGTLKDRVDEAWQSIKAGLVSGVSIGFRSVDEAFNKDTGGLRFLKTEVMELSLVTVPANASATIHTIKSLDLAASGPHSPGATGSLPVVTALKDAPPMTIHEQITQFENTRAAKAAGPATP